MLIFALVVVALHTAQAAAQRTVAVLVERPSNVLAWGALGDEAALMLGCGQILGDYVARSTEIDLVGRGEVNGVYRAVKTGLYRASGETLAERWGAFLPADVYIACDLTRRRLTWRAAGPDGLVATRHVDRPYERPRTCAAALVELVFQAAGADLADPWVERLDRGKATPPAVFFNWAKWIGYRPHWAHDSPWEGPHNSAKRILEAEATSEEPFARAAGWALNMLLRKGKNKARAPASPAYVPQALRVLDSPHAERAMPFLRNQFASAEVLREGLGGLDLPALDLAVGVDVDSAPTDEGAFDLPDPDADEAGKPPAGARFRANLARTLGGVRGTLARDVLLELLRSDDATSVRAAAATALGGHASDASADAVERALDDDAPDVRAAALAALVTLERCDASHVERAAGDPEPQVRAQLAGALDRADVPAGVKRAAWLELAGDEAPGVRAAALAKLRERTDLAPADSSVRPAIAAALSGAGEQRLVALRWIGAAGADGFADPIERLLGDAEPATRAAAAQALGRIAP
ncbi:MAG: HEAT repeat domain-containing protein, partial [Planctomycetota bacterium]